MAKFRVLVGFVAAVAATAFIGSVFATYIDTASIVAAGAPVPLNMRLQMMLFDLKSFAPAYAGVTAIGFAIAFAIAAYLKRILVPLAPLAYPIAGAAAVAAAFLLMNMWFEGEIVVSATRDALGFTLQCLAGALGGAVFGWIAKPRD